MFEDHPPSLPPPATHGDIAVSSVKAALGVLGPLLLGPMGVVVSEFIGHFVPRQRADRLQQFVEILDERMAGLEDAVRDRLQTSAAYAALTEDATVAAVRTPSNERRRDLAALLRTGLSRADAELLEHQALLRLLEPLNDAQVIILVFHGAFRDTMANEEREAFAKKHADVLRVPAPHLKHRPGELQRWTMKQHYIAELVQAGLISREPFWKDRPEQGMRETVTPLGRMLLEAIERTKVLADGDGSADGATAGASNS